MTMMGQTPQPDNWARILAFLRFAWKLPFVVLAIVAAAMGGWVGFWFIVRVCMYAYETWLKTPWN